MQNQENVKKDNRKRKIKFRKSYSETCEKKQKVSQRTNDLKWSHFLLSKENDVVEMWCDADKAEQNNWDHSTTEELLIPLVEVNTNTDDDDDDNTSEICAEVDYYGDDVDDDEEEDDKRNAYEDAGEVFERLYNGEDEIDNDNYWCQVIEEERDNDNDDSDDNSEIEDSPSVNHPIQFGPISPDFLYCKSGFNIVKDTEEIVNNLCSFETPKDFDQQLFPTIKECNIDVGTFANTVHSFAGRHKISKEGVNELLMMFENVFTIPHIASNIPLDRNLRKDKFHFSSKINEYVVDSKTHSFTYHICRSGCIVFVGEYSEALSCPTCKKDRFYTCNPCMKANRNVCTHNIESRTPFAFLQYRPIIPLFVFLIKQPGFLFSLNYVNRDSPVNSAFSPYNNVMKDNCDCSAYRIAMEKLALSKTEFLQANPQYKEQIPFIHVPLILSVFLDGGQVFKKKSVVFKPQFITINNLPPFLRNKLGVGSFLVSLFTSIQGSNAEQFLYMDCFISELNKLQEGIMQEIDGKFYFIQAYCYKHICDTAEMQKYLRCNFLNSNDGCLLCTSIHGYTRNEIDKVTCVGHRYFLEPDNFIRACGQSKHCCPRAYYNKPQSQPPKKGKKKKKTTIDNNVPNVPLAVVDDDVFVPLAVPTDVDPATVQAVHATDLSKEEKKLFVASICCGDYQNVAKELMHTNRYSFHHKDVDLTKLKSFLYYHHMDYRKQKLYHRTTNEEYKRFAQNGYYNVYGEWYYCRYNKSDMRTEIGPDPMHVFKNVLKNNICCMLAKRVSSKLAQYCKSILSHPSLYPKQQKKKEKKKEKENKNSDDGKLSDDSTNSKKGRGQDKPWTNAAYVVKPAVQSKADAWINAIIPPVGYAQDFQVQNIFSQPGYLRSESLLKWGVNLLNFTMSAVDLPAAYKEFFSMVSSDITEMCSPTILFEDIDELFLKAAETAATHEGIFTEYDAIPCWHQFCCMVQQMKHFGPVHLWWAFAGERLLGLLKRFVPRGGAAYSKSTFQDYLKSEVSTIVNAYSKFTPEILENEEERNRLPLFVNHADNFYVETIGNKKILVYTDEISLLKRPDVQYKDDLVFTLDELEDIVITICVNIQKRCASIAQCATRSPLYRLYYLFHNCVPTNVKVSQYENKFIRWAKAMYDSCCEENYPLNPFEYTKEHDKDSISVDNILTYLDDTKTIDWNELSILKQLVDTGLSVKLFKKATIFGIRFRSRGLHCKENSKSHDMQQHRYGADGFDNDRCWPINIHNELKNHWFKKDDRSSWAKIRYTPNIGTAGDTRDDVCGTATYDDIANYIYGQFNSFLQVYIAEDSFVNNIMLGSVTCRRHTTIDRVDYIIADNDGDSYFVHKLFVALDDVYSTPIMTCAFKSAKGKEKDDYHDHLLLQQIQQRNKQLQTEKRKRNKISSHIWNRENRELFSVRTRRILSSMRSNRPVPFYLGRNEYNENKFKYTPLTEIKQISYLVMLELYRNRYLIRYNRRTENLRRKEFSPKFKTKIAIKHSFV